jgi:hypothetical protein
MINSTFKLHILCHSMLVRWVIFALVHFTLGHSPWGNIVPWVIFHFGPFYIGSHSTFSHYSSSRSWLNHSTLSHSPHSHLVILRSVRESKQLLGKQDHTTKGLCFYLKTIFIPSPLSKMIFPLSRHVFFGLLSCPFYLNSSLICIYVTLIPSSFFFPLSSFFSTLSSFFSHNFETSWGQLMKETT